MLYWSVTAEKTARLGLIPALWRLVAGLAVPDKNHPPFPRARSRDVLCVGTALLKIILVVRGSSLSSYHKQCSSVHWPVDKQKY